MHLWLIGLLATWHCTVAITGVNATGDSDIHHQHNPMADADLSELLTVGASGSGGNGGGSIGAHDLVLLPNALEFPQTSLHTPSTKLVIIFNNHPNRTVYLKNVISLPTVPHTDYHVSFVHDKPIPPQGNVTFNVVFLPTRVKRIEAALFIHTTFGLLKYSVRGQGIPSPYKIAPLTGLSLVWTETQIPDIVVYNPHSAPIQITEIYSSGGGFHLQLPDNGENGKLSGRDDPWLIPPYESRTVIGFSHAFYKPGNYSAFIRIKITADIPEFEEKVLIVPIQAVLAVAPKDVKLAPHKAFIDMRTVATGDTDASFNVYLKHYRTGQDTDGGVTIESVEFEAELTVAPDFNKFFTYSGSVGYDLKPMRDTDEDPNMIRLVCRVPWLDVYTTSLLQAPDSKVLHIYGAVTVTTNVESLRLPLFAELVVGAKLAASSENITLLLHRAAPNVASKLFIRNTLTVPVAITRVEVGGGPQETAHSDAVKDVLYRLQQRYKLKKVPQILQPNEEFNITPRLSIPDNFTLGENFHKEVVVATNASSESIRVPLLGFSGQLRRIIIREEYHRLFEACHDAQRQHPQEGMPPTAENLILSDNVKDIDFGVIQLEKSKYKYLILINENPVPVTIMDMQLRNIIAASLFSVSGSCCGAKFNYNDLRPSCDTLEPNEWKLFKFKVNFKTEGDVNGTFQYVTNYETANLSISVSAKIGQLTPTDQSLSLLDCFPTKVCSVDLHIRSTYSYPVRVERLITYYGDRFAFVTDVIAPNTVTSIGRLYFNRAPSQIDSRYVGGSMASMKYPHELSSLKSYLLKKLKLFEIMKERVLKVPYQLLIPNSHYEFHVTVDFIWPKIIQDRDSLNITTLMIDQDHTRYVRVHNPSDELLMYQYFFLDSVADVRDLPEIVLSPCPSCMQTIRSQEPAKRRIFRSPASDRGEFLLLKPHSTHDIPITMSALQADAGQYATTLLIVNNLTILEGIWLTTNVVSPEFTFQSVSPGSTTDFRFDVTLEQAQYCKPDRFIAISVKHIYTAKNTGQLPITVRGLSISGSPCSGNGFMVANCTGFVLDAINGTQSIEISYTPDFTIDEQARQLIFHTDLQMNLNYTIIGRTPRLVMDMCARLVKRPWWEERLRQIVLIFLVTTIVVVVATAYIDSLKIMQEHDIEMSRRRGPFQAPLDFRKLTTERKPQIVPSPATTSTEVPNHHKVATKKKSSIFNGKRFNWFKTTPIPTTKTESIESEKTPEKQTKVSQHHKTASNNKSEKQSATTVETNSNCDRGSGEKKKSKRDQAPKKAKSKGAKAARQSDLNLKPKEVHDQQAESRNGHNDPKTEVLQIAEPESAKQMESDKVVSVDATQSKQHGKTPGRERKEKQNKNELTNGNRLSLPFTNEHIPNNKSVEDNWKADPNQLDYERLRNNGYDESAPSFPSMPCFNQLESNLFPDRFGLSQIADERQQSDVPYSADSLAAVPEFPQRYENPLGAIGTRPVGAQVQSDLWWNSNNSNIVNASNSNVYPSPRPQQTTNAMVYGNSLPHPQQHMTNLLNGNGMRSGAYAAPYDHNSSPSHQMSSSANRGDPYNYPDINAYDSSIGALLMKEQRLALLRLLATAPSPDLNLIRTLQFEEQQLQTQQLPQWPNNHQQRSPNNNMDWMTTASSSRSLTMYPPPGLPQPGNMNNGVPLPQQQQQQHRQQPSSNTGAYDPFRAIWDDPKWNSRQN